MKYWYMNFWYPKLANYTIPSEKVNVPKELNDFIREKFNPDVVFTKKEVSKIEEYIKKEFPEFYNEFYEKKKTLGTGAVFVRTDIVSPKDVWEMYSFSFIRGRENVAILSKFAKTVGEVIASLISSERVVALHFYREEYPIKHLWLRKPIDLKSEIRVFFSNWKPFAITQYYYKTYDELLNFSLPTLVKSTLDLFNKINFKELGFPDKIVVDVGFVKMKPIIVEVNPFDSSPFGTNPCLFEWDELLKFAEKQDEKIIVRINTLKTETVTFTPEDLEAVI